MSFPNSLLLLLGKHWQWNSEVNKGVINTTSWSGKIKSSKIATEQLKNDGINVQIFSKSMLSGDTCVASALIPSDLLVNKPNSWQTLRRDAQNNGKLAGKIALKANYIPTNKEAAEVSIKTLHLLYILLQTTICYLGRYRSNFCYSATNW